MFTVICKRSGLPLRRMGYLLHVSQVTGRQLIRKLVPELCLKLQPEGHVLMLELDERWHYLHSKNKLWIWKAMCSPFGRLFDWEFGNHDREILSKLIEWLKPWSVLFYCTDHYEAYKYLIPPHLLFQKKAGTHAIERNNGQQRHGFLRFNRKSIAPSRSLEMFHLTTGLFAAYPLNKTLVVPWISN